MRHEGFEDFIGSAEPKFSKAAEAQSQGLMAVSALQRNGGVAVEAAEVELSMPDIPDSVVLGEE